EKPRAVPRMERRWELLMVDVAWLGQSLMLLPGLLTWLFGTKDIAGAVAEHIVADFFVEGGKGAWTKLRANPRLNHDILRAIRAAQLKSLAEFGRVQAKELADDPDAAQFALAVRDYAEVRRRAIVADTRGGRLFGVPALQPKFLDNLNAIIA